MSDQDSLFENNDPQITPQETQTTNPLENLVGEGKKYSSAEELAKAYQNADRFIDQLQKEQAALRDELNVRLSVEDVMTQLQQKDSQQQAQSTPVTQAAGNGGAPESKTNVVSQEEIASTVDSILSKKDQERKRAANINQSKTALASAGWDSTKLRTEIAKSGYDEKFVESLAETEPKAFIRLFGLEQAVGEQSLMAPNVTPPTTQVNTATSNLNSSGVKGKKYYDNLRREDPARFFNPTTQNEIFKFIEQHGEEAYYNN